MYDVCMYVHVRMCVCMYVGVAFNTGFTMYSIYASTVYVHTYMYSCTYVRKCLFAVTYAGC